MQKEHVHRDSYNLWRRKTKYIHENVYFIRVWLMFIPRKHRIKCLINTVQLYLVLWIQNKLLLPCYAIIENYTNFGIHINWIWLSSQTVKWDCQRSMHFELINFI